MSALRGPADDPAERGAIEASGAQQILDDERAYLESARAELDRMRRHTLSLDAHSGDGVSAQYLAAALYRRAMSLTDDPGTALFFGRTDHLDHQCWYIGRRHVADSDGDPVVVDWRADISRGFYRAGAAEPMDVVRRRRFGIEAGEITAFEDEVLQTPDGAALTAAAPSASGSLILTREIERPRIGPMRDIVATIQPEQDKIVRSDLAHSVCIQGAPGTGKTAVGLHRAAWLLYAHREQLSRSGVLVVGPNAAFLEHIAAVLPSLGEVEVRHTTVDGLTSSRVRPTGTAVARKQSAAAPKRQTKAQAEAVPAREAIAGDARMATVLHRLVWGGLRTATQPLVVPRGVRRWRVPAYEVNDIVTELAERGARYGAAGSMLGQRLAHAVLVQMENDGDSPDDRVQDSVARSAPVKAMVASIWPQVVPTKALYALFTDAQLMAKCADGVLTDDEQGLLLWPTPPRSVGVTRWTPAEFALLDELSDLIDRTPSLGHVVLDEAQDLSAMQLRAVSRRCATGSVTVLGDIAQGTTPWATDSWAQTLEHLGQPNATITELDQGFRVPSAVIEYAAHLLPAMAPGLNAPTSVRDEPGSLSITHAETPDLLWPTVIGAVNAALLRQGSVGVIVADGSIADASAALTTAGLEFHALGEPALAVSNQIDSSSADLLDAALADGDAHPPRISLVPARTAKGLEYDHVVVVEPTAISDAEPDHRTGLRRLYVVLTRAVSGLTIVHHRPLPSELPHA